MTPAGKSAQAQRDAYGVSGSPESNREMFGNQRVPHPLENALRENAISDAKMAKDPTLAAIEDMHERTENQLELLRRDLVAARCEVIRWGRFMTTVLAVFFALVALLLNGCGGVSESNPLDLVEAITTPQSDGCPVAIYPEPDAEFLAVEVANQWNATGNSCGVVLASEGAPVGREMQYYQVLGLVADLVCEASPC